MKVCLLNGGFDTALVSAERLLSLYWHVAKLAAALATRGHQVMVIQAFHHDESVQLGEVAIEFVATSYGQHAKWAEMTRFTEIACKLDSYQPDIVHVFGLTMLPLRRDLGRWCAEFAVGLTASFHGGQPGRNPLTRWRQRQALRDVSGFFFSDPVAVQQWRAAGVISDRAQVAVVSEVSSPFAGLPMQSARRSLGVDGDPVFAWSGRLDPVKDPMTALAGFRRICGKSPRARLLMAFCSAPLMPDVERFLGENPVIRERVTLLGELPHEQIEVLFSAADFFVQASRREIGGNSLVEAMSCGAIPLVTDIPSFRVLTQEIGPARLFECGDADGMAAAFDEFSTRDLDALRHEVKAGFRRCLAYQVLAQTYETIFVSAVDAATRGVAR